MAPYCITMLLTTDYGGRTKGRPKAPKVQTPHYCTGQGRASNWLTAPIGYKIPHSSTGDPCTQGPGLQDPRGDGGQRHPTRPQGLRGTRAYRQGSPYSMIFEATPIRVPSSEFRVRVSELSGRKFRARNPDLRCLITSSDQYLAACNRSTGSEPDFPSSELGTRNFRLGNSENPT